MSQREPILGVQELHLRALIQRRRESGPSLDDGQYWQGRIDEYCELRHIRQEDVPHLDLGLDQYHP